MAPLYGSMAREIFTISFGNKQKEGHSEVHPPPTPQTIDCPIGHCNHAQLLTVVYDFLGILHSSVCIAF